MADRCGNCEYLPKPDKGGFAWCKECNNTDLEGGYCHVESPACTNFKPKQIQFFDEFSKFTDGIYKKIKESRQNRRWQC